MSGTGRGDLVAMPGRPVHWDSLSLSSHHSAESTQASLRLAHDTAQSIAIRPSAAPPALQCCCMGGKAMLGTQRTHCVQGTTISLSSRIASLAIDHASQDDHASLDDHKGGSICGSTHSAHHVSSWPDMCLCPCHDLRMVPTVSADAYGSWRSIPAHRLPHSRTPSSVTAEVLRFAEQSARMTR